MLSYRSTFFVLGDKLQANQQDQVCERAQKRLGSPYHQVQRQALTDQWVSLSIINWEGAKKKNSEDFFF